MLAVKVAAFGMAILIVMTGSAQAYLDPGISRFLVQGIIAVFAGGTVLIGAYWSNLKRLVSLVLSKTIRKQIAAGRDETG